MKNDWTCRIFHAAACSNSNEKKFQNGRVRARSRIKWQTFANTIIYTLICIFSDPRSKIKIFFYIYFRFFHFGKKHLIKYYKIKYYIYINTKNKLSNFNINISISFEMSNYRICQSYTFFFLFEFTEYFTSQSNLTLSSFSRLEYSLLN